MFERQCWWITGASSGIGEALARALSSKGASVILSGRNVAALEAVAKDCPDALVLPFEATDYASIPSLVERAWAWQGRVHGLVNNAGISQRSLAIDNGLPPEEAAQEILAAIETEKRELVLAKGMEHDVVVMRRKDPEALFDRLSAMVRDGYAKKLAADKGGAKPG